MVCSFVGSSVMKAPGSLGLWRQRDQERLQKLCPELRAELGFIESGRRALAARLYLNQGSFVLTYLIYCASG